MSTYDILICRFKYLFSKLFILKINCVDIYIYIWTRVFMHNLLKLHRVVLMKSFIYIHTYIHSQTYICIHTYIHIIVSNLSLDVYIDGRNNCCASPGSLIQVRN